MAVDERLFRAQMLTIFAVVTIAFTTIAVRTEIQQRQINANSRRLSQVVYAQCMVQSQTAARQIVLIDSAIAAERRKPRPDTKRLADLEKFRPSPINCGRKP